MAPLLHLGLTYFEKVSFPTDHWSRKGARGVGVESPFWMVWQFWNVMVKHQVTMTLVTVENGYSSGKLTSNPVQCSTTYSFAGDLLEKMAILCSFANHDCHQPSNCSMNLCPTHHFKISFTPSKNSPKVASNWKSWRVQTKSIHFTPNNSADSNLFTTTNLFHENPYAPCRGYI